MAFGVAACARAEVAIEGRSCDEGGRCVDGYVCGEAWTCVPAGQGDADEGVGGGDADGALGDPDLDPGDLDSGDADVDLGDGDGDVAPGDDLQGDADGGDGDGPPDPCVGQLDVDGDGLCAALDCDDTLPTCTTDCTTNTDVGGESIAVPDCVELYCGALIDDPASTCKLAGTQAELTAALSAAATTAEYDHVLLDDIALAGTVTVSTNNVAILQRRGAVITATSAMNEAFVVTGAAVRLSGLSLDGASAVKDGIKITGTDTTVEDTLVLAAKETGIYVHGGVTTLLARNVVVGLTSASGNERGGIVLRDAVTTTLVGNILAANVSDGLQLRNAVNTTIDHNTIADNGEDGVDFYNAASTGTCMRNNDISGNGAFAIMETVGGSSWDTTAACTAALAAGPAYGNNEFGHTLPCGGVTCAVCACLPAGTFWQTNADPAYRSTVVGDAGAFCADAAALTDAASDLGRDLNGAASGTYSGAGPDIGAGDTPWCR